MNAMKHSLILLSFLYFFTFSTSTKADEEPSSMRRLMQASRPAVETQMTIPMERIFPSILLSAQPSPFENVNLISEENDASPMQNESSIAANPLNPQVLIASAVDYRDGQSAWVYVSTDGGYHWKNIDLGKPSGMNFIVGNDPSVAWDAEGRGYLVYGGFDAKRTSGENGVFMSVTTDNGLTWTKHMPVILHRGTMTKDSAFEDKYYINVDNSASSPYKGRLYIPWKRVYDKDSSTQIVITHSADHGATWTTPVRVSTVLTGKSLDTTFGQSFPICATGPKGEVYVAWNYGPQHAIGFNSSADGGQTWGSPRNVISYQWLGVAMNMGSQYNHTLKGGTRVESYPSLVCDTTQSPRRGWLYLSWAADRTPNVYFARSTDGGSSWSTPVVVHRDTTNDQYWQWMAIDGTTGDLAIMYLDSRDDKNNQLSRCYVSLSRDGGTTWIDRPVDDVGFDIRRNPFGGGNISGVFAGDYSGCAFIAGKIFPSHVDMRNTYPNVGDNDVYSAVININAPNPDENFTAKTLVSFPDQISLDWTIPTHRTFGETLSSSDFKHRLYRDNVLVRELPGPTTHYVDTVAAFSSHTYRILVVAQPSNDSSAARTVVGYAGGAAQPRAAILLSAHNDSTACGIRVLTPALRADSVTPLVNIAGLRIYRDSIFVKEEKLSVGDTAKSMSFSMPQSEPGYYRIAVSVVDALGHESARSADTTLYIGPLTAGAADNFDQSRLARYLVGGDWQLTDEFADSQPNCITESKRSQYPSLARDTIVFFPMRVARDGGLYITFKHAAIVDKTDTAIVEVGVLGFDGRDSIWTQLAAYNRTNFDEWQNAVLNAADWKSELLHYVCSRGTVLKLRLRFKANIGVNADGWYVDDLRFGDQVDAVEGQDEGYEIAVYPNPATSHIKVASAQPSVLRVLNVLGTELMRLELSDETSDLDVSQLPSGSYVLDFEQQGKRKMKVVRIVH